MSLEPLDFEAIIREIKAVKEKYGVPRGIFFVPDKLEMHACKKEVDEKSKAIVQLLLLRFRGSSESPSRDP